MSKLIALVLIACNPPELATARHAFATQDYATAVTVYEKICSENPKQQLWQEEFARAASAFEAQVLADKRFELSHEQVESLVAELVRRGDRTGAANVLFNRAELNAENRHWLDAADYLFRAADLDPKQGDHYEKQAVEILMTKADAATAAPVAAAKSTAFPHSPRLCELNAAVLAKQYKYDAAIAEYTRCQEIDPDSFANQLKFGAELAALEAYKANEARNAKRR